MGVVLRGRGEGEARGNMGEFNLQPVLFPSEAVDKADVQATLCQTPDAVQSVRVPPKLLQACVTARHWGHGSHVQEQSLLAEEG